MPIIGFSLKSVNGNATGKKADGDIKINSTPSVDGIKKKELNVAGLKDVLSIEFSFSTKYEPDIGDITITGEVIYQTDDAKNILALWGEKKIDTKIAVDVVNVIFKKCLTKAITIADELNLPPPINFPVVQPGRPVREKSAA